MARAPVQERSKGKVERILAAAKLLLADQAAAPTLRTLAEKAGVSLGTVYQYFDSMDDVRAEVGRRASELLRETLARRVPAALAAHPDRYFAALVAAVDELQHANPEFGCMVRAANRSAFVEALGAELRAVVEHHVRASFEGVLADDALTSRTRLDMALVTLLALLAQAPGRDDSHRLAYVAHAVRAASALLQPAAT